MTKVWHFRQCKNDIYIMRLVLVIDETWFRNKITCSLYLWSNILWKNMNFECFKDVDHECKTKIWSQFSLVISNNKNQFLHEHDSTKTMKLKKTRIRFQSIFNLNLKKKQIFGIQSIIYRGSTLHARSLEFPSYEHTQLNNSWNVCESVLKVFFTLVVDCLVHLNSLRTFHV